jgi:hypothetical protein
MISYKQKNILIVVIFFLIILVSFKVNSQSAPPADEDRGLIILGAEVIDQLPKIAELPQETDALPERGTEESEKEINKSEDTLMNTNLEELNETNTTQEKTNETQEETNISQEDSVLVDLEIINYNADTQYTSQVEAAKEAINNNISSPENRTNEETQEQKSSLTEDIRIYDQGKIVLEVKDAPLGVKVSKEEEMNEKGNKEVTISSEQHIEEGIISYTEIPETPKEQEGSIKVYWINEKKEMPIEAFIDSNNNALYDRISWIVPHLSNQTFEIIIESEEYNCSDELRIDAIKAPSGEMSNPIEFEFTINYSKADNLACNFSLDGIVDLTNITNQSFEKQYTLQNGNHTWTFGCFDLSNQNSSTLTDTFIINENFSVSVSKEVYVLDGSGNLLGGNGELNINSAKSSNVTIKISDASSVYYQKNTTTPYKEILNNSLINKTGNYTITTVFNHLAEPVSLENKFSVAKLELSANDEHVKTNEDVSISVKIESPINNIEWYKINFGDENETTATFDSPQSLVQKTIKHRYASSGNFTVTLTARISSQSYTITKNGISVENSKDTEKPKVRLMNPEDGLIIQNKEIVFAYNASDNIKIQNCTFELYNYSSGLGTLDYSKTSEGIENNKRIEISLQDFENSRYSWNVYCCDNSSNCNGDLEYSRDFTVNLNSPPLTNKENIFDHEKKAEIDDLISKIDSFIQKEGSYSIEEKEILEELEISKELDTDRKILAQINTFLGNDINFIEDAALKEKTKKERESQIEEIKSRIPLDIKIVASDEYVKNSLTKNMQEITQDYATAKNIKADKKSLETLSDLNYNLQNYIVVSTKVKQVEIDYVDSKKQLTLITKTLEIKNNTFDSLLEVIPKEIIENASKATFLVESQVIKEDPIFEISVDNLKDEKIIYYIEGLIDVKKIQDTDTLAFKEFAISNQITGFFVLDLNIDNLVYYIIFGICIILIVFLLLYYLKKRKILRWKKEENVVRIFSSIREADRLLEKKEINSAKEQYHRVQELYPLIPEGCRKYLSKKIERIRVEIDKKEIFSLANEYEQAKKEKREQDALLLYKNIQLIYKRLPKKYQKRIYERIFKNKI